MNAKKEFIQATSYRKVKCAMVTTDDVWGEKELTDDDVFKLPEGYTDEQYQAFLSKLDFEYDDGYGGQVVFGTIWMDDGTWLTRGEYDGSEWWQVHKSPAIPDILTNTLKQNA